MASKSREFNLKIILTTVLFISFTDTYFILKNEHFSQLFWFCNAMLYLIVIGIYFESSIFLTGIFLGALVVQLPWIIDFLLKLLFRYELFGIASYMFDYGFKNIRFYIELDHLLIIPLSIYGIKRFGFNKNGWIFSTIAAFLLNIGAFAFSSNADNVNCVFYSCFNDKITLNNTFVFMMLWASLISILTFILSRIIHKIPILKTMSKIN
ncbi:hypothetical protein HYY70_02270 [Candidatus Woesearchaeota archaeon]|nr:hypothetical protein [Candidatus Woesearchaeota archaeon]